MSKRKRNEALSEQEKLMQDTSRTNAKWIKETKEKAKKKKLNYTWEDFVGFDEDFAFIRPIEKWKRKSHNKERQMEEFIKYAFFKYEVPTWAMYMMKKIFNHYECSNMGLSVESKKLDQYLAYSVTNKDILQCAMSGKGYKETLGHMFTKKEIHHIVTSEEEELERVYRLAKIRTYTNDKSLINFFMERSEFGTVIKGANSFYNIGASFASRFGEETDEEFFGRKKRNFETFLTTDKYFKLMVYLLKHNLTANDCQEIYDFFYSVSIYSQSHTRAVGRGLARGSFLYINEEIVMIDDFFKRSIGNVIAMSNEWHIARANARTTNVKAPSIWDKRFDDYEMGRFKVQELNTANLLSAEGKAMGHCVGSYAFRCGRGDCNILSLKRDDGRLLTMEVVKDRIVQIKGKHNRSPNEYEVEVVKNIANHLKLSVSA